VSIKMQLSGSENLTVETPLGTVLVSYLNDYMLSTAFYTDQDSNPVSAVLVKADGDIVQVHSPDEPTPERLVGRNLRRLEAINDVLRRAVEGDSITAHGDLGVLAAAILNAVERADTMGDTDE
jgi:hypothetical protein